MKEAGKTANAMASGSISGLQVPTMKVHGSKARSKAWASILCQMVEFTKDYGRKEKCMVKGP